MNDQAILKAHAVKMSDRSITAERILRIIRQKLELVLIAQSLTLFVALGPVSTLHITDLLLLVRERREVFKNSQVFR